MKKQFGLTGTQLKLLAIACMTIDHAAMLFMTPGSTAYLLLRGIGRWTAPIMAFLLAQGFRHTRNFKKYLLRMLLFAVISQPFYIVMLDHHVPESMKEFCSTLNVMASMAAALIMMKMTSGIRSDAVKKPGKLLRCLLVIPCCAFASFCDWKTLIPVWAVLFYFFRDRNRSRSLLFLIVTSVLLFTDFYPSYENIKTFSFQLGTLTALLPISLYNGERGGGTGKAARAFSRWAFYVYYPMHMGVLTVLWMLWR